MSNNNVSFAAAATRIAAKHTARKGQVVPAKAVRPVLQDVKLVRTGGNAANGLLAVGGASLVINQRIARQEGIAIAALLQEVATCPRVSNPLGKISDHLANNIAYADKARLASCGILQALRADALPQGLPALCIDGKPVMRVTRKQLSVLANSLPDAVLTSPLLAAIAAYTQGKTCPEWARAYGMPQEAATTDTSTQDATQADSPKARKRSRVKAVAAA